MDRFSSLPDDVLCQILSFLPTKYAALTSVLSKRWLNLWKLFPNLNIDATEFLHPEQGKSERVEIKQSFVEFVDNVLDSQGDSPIEKFTLKCVTSIHPDTMNRWICNVLRRGVSDLDLFIKFSDDEDDYCLPLEFFLSKTLVKLKVTSKVFVNWWDTDWKTCLPQLKSLYIDFSDEIETFIPSFPVLEELRMANMEWDHLDITVSSSSLIKLTLHANGCQEVGNPESFSFNTPNLHYLDYSDVVAEDYPLVNMKKLLEACISLTVTRNDEIKRIREPNNVLLEEDEEDVVLKFSNVLKLMNGIQNVRKLSLRSDTLEVLSLCCDSLPVFNNIIMLGITSDKDRGWQALPALLKKCPKLETIIFEGGLLHHVTDKCGDACYCISREDKGRSLASCPVKMIEIQGFRGTAKELRIIMHFLDYLPCLKLMKVYFEGDKPTQEMLVHPEIASQMIEMFRIKNRGTGKIVLEWIDIYKEVSSCDVQLLVSGHLNKKWTEEGI